jgi:hypothetical protein
VKKGVLSIDLRATGFGVSALSASSPTTVTCELRAASSGMKEKTK